MSIFYKHSKTLLLEANVGLGTFQLNRNTFAFGKCVHTLLHIFILNIINLYKYINISIIYLSQKYEVEILYFDT